MLDRLKGLAGFAYAVGYVGLLQQVDMLRPWQVMLWDFVSVLALGFQAICRLTGLLASCFRLVLMLIRFEGLKVQAWCFLLMASAGLSQCRF